MGWRVFHGIAGAGALVLAAQLVWAWWHGTEPWASLWVWAFLGLTEFSMRELERAGGSDPDARPTECNVSR
jgi:hypothetical protein